MALAIGASYLLAYVPGIKAYYINQTVPYDVKNPL